MSSELPSWFTPALERQSLTLASGNANEVCGLYIREGATGSVRLHVLSGIATPESVTADPQVVVRFAYEAAFRDWQVCGTLHSHPRGPGRFSKRDEQLLDWAHWHGLCYPERGIWRTVWGKRGVIGEHVNHVGL